MQSTSTYLDLPKPPPCRCRFTGYCPRCGTYEPAVRDPQVLSCIYPKREGLGGQRIVKKSLEK